MFGPGTIEALHNRLTSCISGQDVLTVDWSFFDGTVPSFILEDIHNMDKSAIDYSKWKGLDGKVYSFYKEESKMAKKWERVHDFVSDYFINTRLMFPEGTIMRKKKGIPSGSMYTGCTGTKCNTLVCMTLMFYLEKMVISIRSLGDDDHIRTWGFRWEDLAEFKRLAWRYFKMRVNEKKCQIVSVEDSDNRTFLGYKFKGARFKRDTEEWFQRALYIERDVPNLTISGSRILGLYLIGGVSNPDFCRFCHYFFGVYPMENRKFEFQHDIVRMFNYVFNIDITKSIPNIREIDPLVAEVFLTTGIPLV